MCCGKWEGSQFAQGKSPINSLEGFGSYAKRRLTKFNGLSPQTFYLHLKETESRFDNREENLYKILLKKWRKNPP